jgi:hypothetical protein
MIKIKIISGVYGGPLLYNVGIKMLRETRELHFLLKNCEIIKASNLVNFFKAHSNDSSIEKKSHI